MERQILTPKFPHFLHGGDYNPDQWLDRPDILEKDIELMKKAHVNCVSLGIFAWAKLEPQEGVYCFDWLETIINNLYENGIYTILATPSGAKPLWMSEKYSEIRRVSKTLQAIPALLCGISPTNLAAPAIARCAKRRSATGCVKNMVPWKI